MHVSYSKSLVEKHPSYKSLYSTTTFDSFCENSALNFNYCLKRVRHQRSRKYPNLSCLWIVVDICWHVCQGQLTNSYKNVSFKKLKIIEKLFIIPSCLCCVNGCYYRCHELECIAKNHVCRLQHRKWTTNSVQYTWTYPVIFSATLGEQPVWSYGVSSGTTHHSRYASLSIQDPRNQWRIQTRRLGEGSQITGRQKVFTCLNTPASLRQSLGITQTLLTAVTKNSNKKNKKQNK